LPASLGKQKSKSKFKKSLLRKIAWFGMMGIGLLADFLFLLEPSWPASGLLNDLSGNDSQLGYGLV